VGRPCDECRTVMLSVGGGAAALGGGIGVIILLALYMLPTIIAAVRKVVNVGSVAAINVLLGWTLIGWAVALAMALRTNPPHAYPQYWQQQPGPHPPGPNQWGHSAGTPWAPPNPPAGPTEPKPYSTAPGWYPNPWGRGNRWWDGERWTRETS
jgi:hypothetical protein